jgi:hypothetical protein
MIRFLAHTMQLTGVKLKYLNEIMTHELKTWPVYYQDIIDGNKSFEVRKDDRGFNVGDVLRLREYGWKKPLDPVIERYTGRYCYVRVDYIYRGIGIQDGYCIMSITQIN